MAKLLTSNPFRLSMGWVFILCTVASWLVPSPALAVVGMAGGLVYAWLEGRRQILKEYKNEEVMVVDVYPPLGSAGSPDSTIRTPSTIAGNDGSISPKRKHFPIFSTEERKGRK